MRKNDNFNFIDCLINEVDSYFKYLFESNYISEKEFEIYKNLKRDFDLEKNLDILKNKIDLPISVIGTTGSGKSTFVNGLLGTKLSPMDADELTNCMINIKHSEKFKEKAYLTTENISPIVDKIDSFENIYSEICNIIDSNEENVINAQINIQLDHLLGKNRKKFKENLNNIENIIDLPGIKSINDQKNLEIIKENISNTFKIFIFDYSSTFKREDRKKIYDVLNTIELKYSENKILFILNKVDLRNEDDKPLSYVINKLSSEIKDNLNLDFEPKIIPFNSLFFYYLQTILFSYDSLKLFGCKRRITKKIINKKIRYCFSDQAKVIINMKLEQENLIPLLNRIENSLKKMNTIPSFKYFHEFWKVGFVQSGGKDFFYNLNSFYSENKISSKKNLTMYFSEVYNLIEKFNFKNLYNFRLLEHKYKNFYKLFENI